MKKYCALLMIIVFSSCELVVDVDVPSDGEQLTVNSLFTPDSTWRVSVALDRYVLDDRPFSRVTDATVVVSDENGPIATLVHEGYGVYRSETLKPEARKRYTLTASNVANGTVTAESFTPPPAFVSNVEIQSNDFDGEPSSRISLQIADEPATDDYYAITVEVGSEYLHSETFEVLSYRFPVALGRNDDGFQNEEVTNDNSLLIKDVFYTGPQLNVTVRSPDWNLIHSGITFVTVKTLSKDYYDFILTSSLQDRTSGNPFAQPVQVYSNVQNGFGIFAGFSSFTVEKSRPKPVIKNVTPQSARRGEQIIVKVDNLNTSLNSNTALIFEAAGQYKLTYSYPIGISDDSITLWVPQDAKSGRLWLQANGRIVEWPGGFTVVD